MFIIQTFRHRKADYGSGHSNISAPAQHTMVLSPPQPHSILSDFCPTLSDMLVNAPASCLVSLWPSSQSWQNGGSHHQVHVRSCLSYTWHLTWAPSSQWTTAMWSSGTNMTQWNGSFGQCRTLDLLVMSRSFLRTKFIRVSSWCSSNIFGRCKSRLPGLWTVMTYLLFHSIAMCIFFPTMPCEGD